MTMGLVFLLIAAGVIWFLLKKTGDGTSDAIKLVLEVTRGRGATATKLVRSIHARACPNYCGATDSHGYPRSA